MSIVSHALAVRRTATGLGLFTLRPVRAGGRVVEYVGTVVTSEEAARSRGKYFFTLDEGRAIDGKGRSNRARYVNHSCRPNSAGHTYGRRIWICALRPIAAGEQITIDYGAEYIDAHFGPQGCRCEPCAAAVAGRTTPQRNLQALSRQSARRVRPGVSRLLVVDDMNTKFREFVEALEPKFQKLVNMTSVKYGALPQELPKRAIYLFSENGKHLYVGRTNNLRNRLRGHCSPSSWHFSAVFAFRIAREDTGFTKASYKPEGSRAHLCEHPVFGPAFLAAKRRVAEMEIRYVEEADPVKQALLEIYAATSLGTPYNDFENH